MNKYTQAYAVAARDAGIRIDDRSLSAVDMLAADLYGWTGGSWSDYLLFVYPFVGGTAISNSFNLADPLKGRITWSTTPPPYHDFNGVTADSVATNYADTGLPGPANYGEVPCMFGVYVRSNISSTAADIYCSSGQTALFLYYTGQSKALLNFGLDSGGAQCTISASVPLSTGFTSAIRHPQYWLDGAMLLYKNGSGIASASKFLGATVPAVGQWVLLGTPNQTMCFAYASPKGAVLYSNQSQFDLWSIVYAFNWRLERQVL
jgi:hypothetical protein